MADRSRKTTSGERADRAPRLEIRVDPTRLALRKLLRQRKRLTRKIKRLPELEARHRIERPDVTMEELLARLERAKTAADAALAKHGRRDGEKANRAPKAGSVAFAATEARFTQREILRENLGYLAALLELLQVQADCTLSGNAAPQLVATGGRVPVLNDLNHNSSAGYQADSQSYLSGQLAYLVAAWLDDDASVWRNDDPDSAMWYDNVCMFLPPAPCDVTVNARFMVRFSGQVRSEADDHNEIRHYVYAAHSDEDGNPPAYVSFGDEYPLTDIDLSGEIGLPLGDRIDSGWVTATMSFPVRAGVTAAVFVANCTELHAQDGTLEIIGTWTISDLTYVMAP
jgi:hypothetical protein